ncbi:hypothetical protein L1887_22214 [Cichorium endivia]|nr:hypothetical protein L1887_22214 [Cichorium endivia]
MHSSEIPGNSSNPLKRSFEAMMNDSTNSQDSRPLEDAVIPQSNLTPTDFISLNMSNNGGSIALSVNHSNVGSNSSNGSNTRMLLLPSHGSDHATSPEKVYEIDDHESLDFDCWTSLISEFGKTYPDMKRDGYLEVKVIMLVHLLPGVILIYWRYFAYDDIIAIATVHDI